MSENTQAGVGEDRPLYPSLWKGWRRKCPNCGSGPLLKGYLKVRDTCPVCHEELHHQRADDGPAYLTILIVGHLMAPILLLAFEIWRPDPLVLFTIFTIGCVALSLYLLPRLKGAMVALQWSKGCTASGVQKGSTISTGIDKIAIRDAATVIVVRDASTAPRILMGQRGAKAAFMPSKFVFPGGAVDAGDSTIPLAAPLPDPCSARLAEQTPEAVARALPIAAIRELWEETGQILGTAGTWPDDVPDDWQGFAERGYLPAAGSMEFVFRAITPPGRPRRFDARFFLIDAEALVTDPDDFTAACDELSHLQWIPLPEVRQFDLPFITEVVLAEIAARLRGGPVPDSVPFYKDRDEDIHFARLGGGSPLS